MVDTVRSRLNHYRTLGVSPTADDAEISRAFARERSVFRPHAFGGLAEICIAYETLRDPAKRRAYDAALGLKREPSAPNRSLGAREAPAAPRAIAPAPVQVPATNAQPPRALPPEPRAWPQPLVDRKLGSADTLVQSRPALPLGPGADIAADPEPRLNRGDISSVPLEEMLGAEVRPVDWRRAGVALGTVVAGACVLGGLAGWWSASAINETPQPENMVSVSLPPAAPLATPATPGIAPPPVSSAPEIKLERRPNTATAADPVQRDPSSPRPVTAEERPEEPQAATIAIEQATEEGAPSPPAVTAAMPLPDRLIARTIEKIGYSCGSVASTVPVEGEAAGVFKVTCSSGQSYQARPVNGRYHFRRWGRR